MNIHEYQAKQLLKKFGIPVAQGYAAFNVEEAESAAKKLSSPLMVLKAQIHAGGRGKAGGVLLCRSVDEVRQGAEKLLGKALITHQTGPKGQVVRRLYVEQGTDIAQELYLSLVLDRASGRVAVIASSAGGMDIEEVAHNTPEKMLTMAIDPVMGYQPFHGRRLSKVFNITGSVAKQAEKVLENLYQAFVQLDASLLEINPLVVTKSGEIMALDAKINFDENALYRQPEVEACRDLDEENPAEIEARQADLSYVKLDGNIGCMVNGAGLAMATMDIIKLHGGEPANFLDVGGGATQEKVAQAFKLILADPNVQAILINIFGGIMRCDVIAQGIIAAAKEISISVPLVVRLQGTNEKEGKELLRHSDLKILSFDDLDVAAAETVRAAREAA